MEELLKKILRQLLKRNAKLLRNIEIIYLKIKNRNYKFESEKRKNLDIYSIEKLVKYIGLYPTEYYFGVSLYGIIDVLKEYSGISPKLKFKGAIEHGLHLGEYYNREEIQKDMGKILTFGKYRESILRKYTENAIYKIGPYIYYAEGIYSNEKIIKIKKKLGKTLVFFPIHSIEKVEMNYEIDLILKKLRELKKEFNTLIVCMYYHDILQNKHLRYLEIGAKIVTAGHKNDKNFLKRLRSIIEIADETASNGVGTHIGYCLCLRKKHFIIETDFEINFTEKDERDNFKKIEEEFKQSTFEIKNVFLKREKKITKEQENIYIKYWGGNHLKTREELRSILTN